MGALLYCYEQRTVIDIPGGAVVTRESLLRLPLRTCEWRLDEFDSVRPKVACSGREGNPAPYSTVTLCGGERDVPLFDMDNYESARKAAGRLASQLGLGTE